MIKEMILILLLCFPESYFVAGFHPNSTYEDFIRDEIFENWMKTDGAGDYNQDGVCNLEDFAIITSDYSFYKSWCTLKFGVIWGTSR